MLFIKLLRLGVVFFLVMQQAQGRHCKWSNEDCLGDAECCSRKCEQVHPGTNSRCTPSQMNGPCMYDHQCENRLKCGDDNRCCAPFWGACSLQEDCCSAEHVCVPAHGFIYKRCLYPEGGQAPLSLTPVCKLVATLVALVFNVRV